LIGFAEGFWLFCEAELRFLLLFLEKEGTNCDLGLCGSFLSLSSSEKRKEKEGTDYAIWVCVEGLGPKVFCEAELPLFASFSGKRRY
jgi:hypothetical protein